MKARLLHERIPVRGIEEAENTKSGLSIPNTAKEKPLKDKVTGSASEAEVKQTPSALATGV